MSGSLSFNDNQCCFDGSDKQSAPVLLRSDTLIVDANRVQGDEGLYFIVSEVDPKAVTVLGNVTTGKSAVQGVALAAPWDALNMSGR